MFENVVCGVDPTSESLEAGRQAARVLAPEGALVLVAAADVGAAAGAGFGATYATDQVRDEAGEALERAKQEIPEHTDARVVDGRAGSALVDVAKRVDATLLVVGAHRHSRAAELLVGSTALAVLRDAPCSALVTRSTDAPGSFPRRILVGLDGSDASRAAAAVAAELAERCGSEIAGVVAKSGKGIDLEAARTQPFDVDVDDAAPVDALKRRAAEADLVVVGSRGLHGLRALGSVSERVANAAPCSVLVVR